jgi:hypothetical protein
MHSATHAGGQTLSGSAPFRLSVTAGVLIVPPVYSRLECKPPLLVPLCQALIAENEKRRGDVAIGRGHLMGDAVKDERERPQTTNCSVADEFPKTVLQCVFYASVPKCGGVGLKPEISHVRAKWEDQPAGCEIDFIARVYGI